MNKQRKTHNARFNELLDTAQALFFSRGYEATPISAILDEAKIAKGTFYHYFASKEELLDRLTARLIEKIRKETDPIIDHDGYTAIEKFNRFLAANRTIKRDEGSLTMLLMRTLYRDENLLLRRSINAKNRERTVPLFAKLIEQGVREGLFSVSHPHETAGLLFDLGVSFAEVMIPLFLSLTQNPGNREIIKRSYAVYQQSMERILGAPADSITLINQADLEGFFRLAVEGAGDTKHSDTH